MPESEMFPLRSVGCEVASCNTPLDFGDTARFRKVEFPEQAGLAANSLLQLVPAELAAEAASSTYVLRFPKGIQGSLMNLHQGGQSAVMKDATGHFVGTASLYRVDPASVAAFQAFSIASFATGQYFLADISSKLTEVNKKLDDLLAFLQTSKRTELLSELTFVKYALANYSTIMLNDAQRIATIGNLQRAKTKAIADIEFYTEQLESAVAGKSNESQAQIVLQSKQGVDLASQLYAISGIMETYYSQNWNESYLANLEADAKPLFALTQNRMIGALKTAADKVSQKIEKDENKHFGKNSVSQIEAEVLKTYNTLSTQAEPPLFALMCTSLKQPSQPLELYLRPDGSVYQKV